MKYKHLYYFLFNILHLETEDEIRQYIVTAKTLKQFSF